MVVAAYSYCSMLLLRRNAEFVAQTYGGEPAKRCHSPVILTMRGARRDEQFQVDLFLLQDEQHNLNIPSKGLFPKMLQVSCIFVGISCAAIPFYA